MFMHDGVVVMRLHGQQIPLIGFLLVSKQWGYVDDASNYSHTIELSFTIAFAAKPYIIDTIIAVKNASSSNFFYALPVSVTNTTAKLYYSGYGSGSNNTRGYYWIAIGV